MKETPKLVQQLTDILNVHWYFIFIYLWLIVATVLHHYRNKDQSNHEEISFNWAVYLVILGALAWLFYANQAAYEALFKGALAILFLPVVFVGELVAGLIKGGIDSLMPSASEGFSLGALIRVLIGIVICLVLLVVVGVFAIIGSILIWLFKGLVEWYFASPYTTPPLALLFYPAASFTFDFLVERLTRHPLEGVLTVRVDRKLWLLLVGASFIIAGIIGKLQ